MDDDTHSKIAEFEALSATEMSVDEILSRLRQMMDGYKVIGTMCFPPLRIFRARRASEFPTWNHVQDLSYPKTGGKFNQRASRQGSQVFYGASSPELALAEIDVKLGDYVVISDWEIAAPILCHIIGMVGIPPHLVPKDERNIRLTEFLNRNFYQNTDRFLVNRNLGVLPL